MASVLIEVTSDNFELTEQGGTYSGVFFALKPGSKSLCVNLRAIDDFANPFKVTVYNAETWKIPVMLQDYLYFDNSMRMITRIPMIEGWDHTITYINYCTGLSAKRKRTE